MFKPDLMGYVLFLPTFILFALPLLLLPLILRQRMIQARAGNSDNRAVVNRKRISDNAGEGREFPRQKLDGVIALVSDGVNCCKVSVNDVSRRGICFACSTEKLNRESDRLGVLLTGAGKSFNLQVKPQWKLFHGAEQNIGATIVDTLGNWEEFTETVNRSRTYRAG